MKIILFLVLSLLCVGCTHIRIQGTDIDLSKIAQIKKGETSKDQVVELLGNPTDKSLVPSGQIKWTYVYSYTEVESNFWTDNTYIKSLLKKKIEILFDDDIVSDIITLETLPNKRAMNK